MKALYFKEFGTSDVLQYGIVGDPVIGKMDLLVEMHYIGVNFADIYRRRGTYHLEAHTPYINGYEGVGKIIAVGGGISAEQIGRTVLFVDVPFANAEHVRVPQDHAIYLPPELDEKLAATIGLQGLTADFLAHDLGKNKAGDKVLVTGISGGVGQILAQMLTADGIEVFGMASSAEKRELAVQRGAREVFNSRENDWVEAHAGTFATVYDGVGVTVPQSLKLIGHRGKIVFFGMAGGNPPAIDLVPLLAQSKSILTGDLWDYLTSFNERKHRSERLFRYFLKQQITVSEPTIFPLAEGKAAHEFLESGKNIGKVLLQP